MRTVANDTPSDPYRGVDIHPIKEHSFFLVAGVTLLDLNQLKFEFVVRCMGVVADDTVSFLNRVVNI
jgi:hypothetical protein